MSLAAIRPDEYNFPLFLHVLGAMLLVGTLVVVVASLIAAWTRGPGGEAVLTRIGFWTLLAGVIPAWLLMRVAGQWVESKGYDDEDAWIGIGYITGDLGLALLVITTILAGLAVRRLRRDDGARSVLARIAAVLVCVMLAMYLVAMWAMTAKPT